MIKHALTNLQAREDNRGSDRAHDAASLRPNVSATVTATDLFSASRDAVLPAGPSGEAGHVRVLNVTVSLDSETGRAFVTDCARNIETLRSDRELKETWGLDERQWAQLAENAQLLDAIKAERERRIRSGDAARETAQRHFAKAPFVLNEILHDRSISPRHRIEAAKELRQAAGGPETVADRGERFVISINLGDDDKLVREFDQPARAPHDGEAQ